MAKKSKDEKEITAEDAQRVIAAARRFTQGLRDFKQSEDQQQGALDATKQEVDDMDRQFQDQKLRILKLDPDGSLTDVSAAIQAKAQPEPTEMSIPMGKDGKIDREAAKEMLARIMQGSSYRPSQPPQSTVAMQRMEATLAKSDEILKHFKD